ncbi:MAG TPA: hypothetical protein VGQ08_12135 [Nitrospiraceae bacterium]|jgi:hypothetical protein|nr:hypothetical protein [Nitrospiraceae bacterium]
MPHIDRLAKAVVEEICHELPSGTFRLEVISEGETIEPGYDVRGYHVDIIPSLAKAPRIMVHAPADSWESNVGFGNYCDTEVWYKKGNEADKVFMQDLKTVITTIMTSRWEERVVLLGGTWASSIAKLPAPIGNVRSLLGFKGLLAPLLPTGLKTENVVVWEPYLESSKSPS